MLESDDGNQVHDWDAVRGRSDILLLVAHHVPALSERSRLMLQVLEQNGYRCNAYDADSDDEKEPGSGEWVQDEPEDALAVRGDLSDHRSLTLNADDFLRCVSVPDEKAANYRDFAGVLSHRDGAPLLSTLALPGDSTGLAAPRRKPLTMLYCCNAWGLDSSCSTQAQAPDHALLLQCLGTQRLLRHPIVASHQLHQCKVLAGCHIWSVLLVVSGAHDESDHIFSFAKELVTFEYNF